MAADQVMAHRPGACENRGMPAARLPLLLLSLLAVSAPGAARAGPPADPPCRACHEEKFAAPRPHLPAAAGLCTACHRVDPAHFDDGEKRHVVTLRLAEQTCLTCHDAPPRQRSGHGALGMEGGCLGCHDPHGGDQPAHLKAALPALCAGCHQVPAAPVEGVPHGGLAAGAACLECHGAHGAPNDHLLLRAAEATCLGCHAERVATLGRKLPGFRWRERDPRDGGVAHEAMKKGCLACHVAHPRPGPGRGLLAEATVEALCFRCHDRKGFKAHTPGRLRHPGIDHPAGGGADPAQPGRAFSCVSCHEPHRSTQPALFRYRPIPGAPEPARRCGHCHPTAMGLPPPAAPPPWSEQDARP